MADERVRVVCEEEGYESCWVEIDVTNWGFAEYMDIWSTAFPLVTLRYFEPFCTAWHVVNDENVAVPHPGRNASRERWTSVYRQLGVKTSRRLGDWFAIACLKAAAEAQSLDPKSARPMPSTGEGVEGAAGRDAGEGTA